MHFALGLTSGAVGTEFARAYLVQNRLRHDRAGRIAGTKKQYVERLIGHGTSHAAEQPHAAAGAGATSGAQHDFS
jgi:hypothetical protein